MVHQRLIEQVPANNNPFFESNKKELDEIDYLKIYKFRMIYLVSQIPGVAQVSG